MMTQQTPSQNQIQGYLLRDGRMMAAYEGQCQLCGEKMVARAEGALTGSLRKLGGFQEILVRSGHHHTEQGDHVHVVVTLKCSKCGVLNFLETTISTRE